MVKNLKNVVRRIFYKNTEVIQCTKKKNNEITNVNKIRN